MTVKTDISLLKEAVKSIPKIIEAYRLNQREEIGRLAEELSKSLETAAPSVSERLKKCMRNTHGLTPLSVQFPSEVLETARGETTLDDVILPPSVRSEVERFIDENMRDEELSRFAVSPRHKMFLSGPPGNGKTSTARAVASALQLPCFEVKFGGLIGGYLGETNKNMEKMFSFASATPCVLFIDEFDTLAFDRTANDVGEVRRIVNQLLLMIDRLPPSTILMAATNLKKLVDSAVTRRFDIVVDLPAPTLELMRECAARELKPELTPGYDATQYIDSIVSSKLDKLSEVVMCCRWIRRDLCLTGGQNVSGYLENLGAVAE